LLASDAPTTNIQEYIVQSAHPPIVAGYYTVPVQLQFNGIPTLIDVNTKYLVVQYGGTAYFFTRGVGDLNPLTYQPFYNNIPLFT
jgi:hypothetical protein